ncbi:hypothetical protein FVEG_10662 [Fusarium verticillioides 7600]|uniref:Uncharacterized protein n=1 Tax=Gibberella moniliformis (strain M3125 / FGSC 7600) TaxID=334819 RepID=W7MVQ4_GIBM7|nr:hypothetical protein FVEG_10662 [Fusarium verticillioides 7600]EWG51775.1 hypothetical protein FVEG_10662 [Fusarium verticillioides 7600]
MTLPGSCEWSRPPELVNHHGTGSTTGSSCILRITFLPWRLNHCSQREFFRLLPPFITNIQLVQLLEHTVARHLSSQPNNNRIHTQRTSTSSHKQLPQTIFTSKMPAALETALETKSIDVHFKLKEGKKYPKTVDLEKLKEQYGEGNVSFVESKNKFFTIQVRKVCDTADQMKEELWPVLEEIEIFKTWEPERIMVWLSDSSCVYLMGDPYPGK